ncbi:hypothetical protein Bca52824_022708 [Brassica carinata]|uniref:Myb/SANT-like domain-containing protein n=1 Tax=Brassica carinata TaxID=52824 RepID=A0A8X7VH68_BRACI|nr:hypothetical protein Bca52824_022708 [Brassica carinata]
MSGRNRGNTNPSGQRNSNVQNETSLRNSFRFKWTYEQETTLTELYDQAISMSNYTFKDPTVLGREFVVERFNRAFNLSVKYSFFKNKLDDFKKTYKKWKFLMTSTGITVDPETSTIYASNEWWKARESVCKITRSFQRQPPEFWDVMVRCFVLHNVYSQPQQSSRQRRQQILNEDIEEDNFLDFSDIDGDDTPQNNVHETQENEEIYRVNVNADTHPSNEYTQDPTRLPSRRGEERTRRGSSSRGSGRRGSNSNTSGRSSGTNVGSSSRGHRRRQSFESTMQDTINGYREFQRQSLQQLCPAEQIFLALELPKFTKFYWACINSLKELIFWRKYFIDIAESNNEDKLQLLEAMTGVSRNNEDVPNQLGSGQLYGSPHSGGLSSGSPSSVVVPVGTHPQTFNNGVRQPYPQQWNIPQNFHHGQHASNSQQASSSGTTPSNVQCGFTVGNQVGSPMNNQRKYPEGTTTYTSPRVHQTPSPNIGFTNYFESGSTSQRPRHGGLFNIWGTTEEHNDGHQSGSGDED